MNTLLALLLTVVITPTMVDRSDFGNNCDSVLSKRAISVEAVNGGFAEGAVNADFVGAVGMVDNKTASYPSCSEFGERFFGAGWLVSATVSRNKGLTVTENGAVVFQQGRPYTASQATITIRHTGNTLRYHLNGRLLFTGKHDGLSNRDLRAYYFGTVGSPLIGTIRNQASRRVLQKVNRLTTERAAW